MNLGGPEYLVGQEEVQIIRNEAALPDGEENTELGREKKLPDNTEKAD